MNESQFFEKFGRMQWQIDQLNYQYDQTAKLLADVISGKVDPSRVLVNLTARTWTISPEGERPAMPATINGLPVCVTAPAKPTADKVDDSAPCTDPA